MEIAIKCTKCYNNNVFLCKIDDSELKRNGTF